MLKIRLQRVGRKNDPSFRVVITDSRNAPKSGSFIEILGSYDARKGKPQFKTNRIEHWLSYGAQISGTVHNLLVDAKILKASKVDVSPKLKAKLAKEETVSEASEEIKEEQPTEESKKEEPAGEAKQVV